MGSSVEYVVVGGIAALVLLMAKIAYRNGIFCLSPCGHQHACIISTNKGDRDIIMAIRLCKAELENKQITEVEFNDKIKHVLKNEESFSSLNNCLDPTNSDGYSDGSLGTP